MKNYLGAYQKGFSLLEVLIALVLFSLIILSVNASQTQYIRSNHEGQVKAEAVYAAQTVIDEIRQKNILSLPTSGSESPKNIVMNSNRNYQVTVSYCSDSSFCTTEDVRHVAVDVSYNGDTVYRTETVFTDFGVAPSATPTPSVTVAASVAPSASASKTPTPSTSGSKTPTPSVSPSKTPTPSPSKTPTPSPSNTPTPSPTKKKCKGWKC